MDEFKDRLNKALEVRGLKPADLAKQSGVSEAAISQYRRGGYKASQNNLEKIAGALRVSIPWLMGADVPMERGWQAEAHAESEATGTLTVTKGPAFDDEANEIMREMYERPELRALFKTSKKVSADDIRMVDKLLKHMAGEDDE